MEEKTFKVEIITPTICGGSDSRNLDSQKIRPSEIKAMMRYAFRTVAGKYIQHKSEIEKLLKAEGEIFGDTSKKSDFKMILKNTENLKSQRIKILPHKDKEKSFTDKEKSFTKEAVMPNQSFELTIIGKKYPLDFYKSLLNMAFLLGVGNRRNRLMGNMQIDYNLSVAKDIETISNICKKILNAEQDYKTDNPKFSSFTFRTNDEKNYLVYSIPLKDTYTPFTPLNFENMLKDLYSKVIHKIEENHNYSKILGSARIRQSSFVNFSVQKTNSGYKLFLIGFYYENNGLDYQTWKKAIDEIKNLTKQTFDKSSKEEVKK
jgi:CRISPR type III-B/RAMP module RAMP protein Cmr1